MCQKTLPESCICSIQEPRKQGTILSKITYTPSPVQWHQEPGASDRSSFIPIFICVNRDTRLAWDRNLEPPNESDDLCHWGFSVSWGWGEASLWGDELVSLRIGKYEKIGPPPQRGELFSKLLGQLNDKFKEPPS